MNIGRLNTRIRIDANIVTQDAYGADVTAWQTLAELWADVRHTSGKEAISGDAIASTAKASMRIRYRTDLTLTAGMRVVVVSTGTVYNILAVLPDVNRREYVDLVCEAVS